MSIENDLGRIATALERIADVQEGKTERVVMYTPPAMVADTPATAVTGKAKKATKPVETKVDDAPELTFVELEKVLRAHNAKFGAKTRILMEKHGATPGKPTMNSIPQANWPAIYEEAKKELA